MKPSEIKTCEDAERFIGKSQSWKRALQASIRKFEIVVDWEEDMESEANDAEYMTGESCGFCMVHSNKHGKHTPYSRSDECPVRPLCEEFRFEGKPSKKVLSELHELEESGVLK